MSPLKNANTYMPPQMTEPVEVPEREVASERFPHADKPNEVLPVQGTDLLSRQALKSTREAVEQPPEHIPEQQPASREYVGYLRLVSQRVGALREKAAA